MPGYASAKETARKWNVTQRRVAVLCAEKRVEGAMMVGNMWIIPSTAEKPEDKRKIKSKAEKQIKPFVKWAGGKTQLIEQIEKTAFADKSYKFTKYAEPMVGGGALFFNIVSKYNIKEVYIGDINAELINAYNIVKSDVDELIIKLKAMQDAFLSMDENGRKAFYYSVRDKFNLLLLNNDTALDKAAYFIFLNKTCFNGLYRVNSKGRFNVPIGRYKNPSICDEENLRKVSLCLKDVIIKCGDYERSADFIDSSTLVYLDPPYRPISKTSEFNSYNSETFNDDEQIRLAKFIDELNDKGAKIVLSNSDPKNTDIKDDFFDELYKNYNIKRVQANRMINSKADGRGKITELLIYN